MFRILPDGTVEPRVIADGLIIDLNSARAQKLLEEELTVWLEFDPPSPPPPASPETK